MRFAALATDYDGTLADEGIVSPAAIETLRRFRASGRRVILLTGRTFASLLEAFPCPDEFDIIVAENGATLYNPATKSERALTDAPPAKFVQALEQAGVYPLDIGRVVVATSESQKQKVLDVIQQLGLELHIVFNKGSLMVLPGGINKATGLQAALNELHLSRHNVAGIGDAENDHAFLAACEFSAAVSNALPIIKQRVHFVAHHKDGRGVSELCDRILSDDLRRERARFGQPILIGRGEAGEDVTVDACGVTLLAGSSGGGKSTLTTAFLEGLLAANYQFCAVDPEGDYELVGPLVLGKPHHVPAVSEILAALQQPEQSVIVNLLSLDLEERPAFFKGLCERLEDFRSKTGRPHSIIADEAHHLLGSKDLPESCLPKDHSGLMLITVKPERLPESLLKSAQLVIAAGDDPEKTLRSYCERVGIDPPTGIVAQRERGQCLGWRPGSPSAFVFTPVETQTTRIRHRRKYAEGELAPERSFYFRGPDGKLNLRAFNLITFLQLMEGVDDETWLFHLKNRDFSDWFRREIKDEDLARDAEQVEQSPDASPLESRARFRTLITTRYTLPA
jgi:HAD superfamily hydrolase (TIGR01484 family)